MPYIHGRSAVEIRNLFSCCGPLGSVGNGHAHSETYQSQSGDCNGTGTQASAKASPYGRGGENGALRNPIFDGEGIKTLSSYHSGIVSGCIPSQSKIKDFCQLPQRGSQGRMEVGRLSGIRAARACPCPTFQYALRWKNRACFTAGMQ